MEVRERDQVLDAWRGVSILLVIVHHAVYFRFADIFRGFLERSADGALQILWYLDYALVEFSERSGPLGVKIFFVISGYIITKLLIEEEARSRTIDILGFYFRRVARILPALLVYAVSVLAFSLLGWIAYDIIGFFAALGFVCNTSIACGQTFIHTWTLSVEEQFYIAWPLLFLLARGWRTPFLIATFVALFAFSAAGIFISHGWINNPLNYACIALGALYATSGVWRAHIQRWGIYESLALVALVLGFSMFPSLHETARQIYWFATPFVILVAITTSYVLTHHVPRIVVWLAWLGLFSYSLYLWQEVFLMETRHYLVFSPLEWPLLLIPIAMMSYFWIERPIIRWGRKITRRPDNSVMPAP